MESRGIRARRRANASSAMFRSRPPWSVVVCIRRWPPRLIRLLAGRSRQRPRRKRRKLRGSTSTWANAVVVHARRAGTPRGVNYGRVNFLQLRKSTPRILCARPRARRTFLINDLARDTFRDLGKKRGEYGSHSSRPHSLKNSISSFLAFLNAIIELPK